MKSEVQYKHGGMSKKNAGKETLISIDTPQNFPTKARREKSAAVIQQKDRYRNTSMSTNARRTGSTVNVQSLLAGGSGGSSRPARNIRAVLSNQPISTGSRNSMRASEMPPSG
jgi:hypothetical protein